MGSPLTSQREKTPEKEESMRKMEAQKTERCTYREIINSVFKSL
jgi:hypothetical protein